MRFWLPAAFSACLVIPAVLPAQALESASPQPSTRPSHSPLESRELARVRKGLGTYAPDNPANNEPLTAEERTAAEKFMETNSPKRWEKLKGIREERKDRILTLVRNQMRMLDRLKTDDPKIYDLRMSRMQIEDEMFSLVWKLKHDKDNTADKDALRASLHDEVQKFVDNSLGEQKIHVEQHAGATAASPGSAQTTDRQQGEARRKSAADYEGQERGGTLNGNPPASIARKRAMMPPPRPPPPNRAPTTASKPHKLFLDSSSLKQ